MVLSPHHFPRLDFADEDVLASTLNPETRRLVIAISGARLEDGSQLIGIRLDISDWSALSIRRYVRDEWISEEGLESVLSDICEFESAGEQLRLAGFLRAAEGWYEPNLTRPRLRVEYDDGP